MQILTNTYNLLIVFTGSSIKIDSKPTTNSLFEEQLVAGSSHFRTSENKASISKGKKTEKSTSSESQKSRTRKNSRSSCNPGTKKHDIFLLLLAFTF